MAMKWLIIPIVLELTGCAYTVVSTGTLVVTGRSVGDHAASVATGNRCDTVGYVLGTQDYVCEQPRELGTTYNRNPL
jgi:hypothetical protein